MLTEKNRNSDGRHYKVYMKITVKVLAEVTGRHEETIRRHIRDESLKPWCLKSIVKWVNENRREEDEE